MIFPISAGDYQAGLNTAAATLTALLAREKLGQGQFVDISKIDVLANNFAHQYVTTYIYRGVSGTRRGHHGGYFYYPCGCLPCKNGHVILIAPQLSQWIRFVEMMGTPEWTKNPRYRDRRKMNEEYPDEADAMLIPWLKEHTKEEIFSLSLQNHLPFAPVWNISEIVNSEHFKSRDFFCNINHSEAGNHLFPGAGYKLSQTPLGVKKPAPLLGQHNEDIFVDRLGYSQTDVVKIQQYEVI